MRILHIKGQVVGMHDHNMVIVQSAALEHLVCLHSGP